MTQVAPLTWTPPGTTRKPLACLTGPAAALFFATCGTVLGLGNPGSSTAQAMVVGCMVVPAFYLAAVESTHLLPYVLTLYMVGPEVRRVVDYSADTYTSVTLVSLIPMLATLAMGLPVARGWHGLPRPLRLPLGLLAGACGYASALGLVLHGQAAIPEAMGWTVPLLVLAYLACRPGDRAEREAWLWSFAAVSVGVSAYTWVQFVTAPPWDMHWMVESGMTSSMGLPIPLQFRAFGPLNSCGTAGVYFPFVIVAVWTARPLRNGLGAIVALLSAAALLITEVRIGWLMTLAMLVAGTIVRGGGSWWRQMTGLAATMGLLMAILPLLPGSSHVQERFQSFGDLKNDNSAQARTALVQSAMGEIISSPLGTGFGASSEAKLAGSSVAVTGIDNGFVAITIYFGWAGAAAFFAGIAMLAKFSLMRDKTAATPEQQIGLGLRPLASSTLAGMLVATLAFTAFAGVSAFVGWLLFGLAFWPPVATGLGRPYRLGPETRART